MSTAPQAATAAIIPDQAPRRLLPACLSASAGKLAQRISEFNRFPTRYAHPSWWPQGWGPDWKKGIIADSRSEARLGEAMLQHWELPYRPCFDFGAPMRRLALLDPAPLNRLVLLAGLARHAEEISRIIVRSQVQKLRFQIGEEAYKFVLLRAPLLTGQLPAGDGATETTDWAERATFTGLSMLSACLGPELQIMSGRVSLKFSRGMIEAWDVKPCPEAPEVLFRLFRKVLLQEVEPAWDVIFS